MVDQTGNAPVPSARLYQPQSDRSSTQAPYMGYVLMGDDPAPVRGKVYPIVPADSLDVGKIPVPSGPERYFDLDVYGFYSGDLPDPSWGSNEAMLRIQVDTRPPQNLGKDATASFVTKCKVKDYHYADGFLYRGVFRNVIFMDYVNLRLALFELDGDAGKYLDKVQAVLKGVPEVRELDVLKGIPYLDVGTKLVEGIIRTFGKNPDDEVWKETPLLSIEPLSGGAFLRRGLYVVFDRGEFDGFPDRLSYKDGHVSVAHDQLTNTHVSMSMGVRQRTP